MVDTGADNTLLMPGDAIRMGLDYSQLSAEQEVGSAGGKMSAYAEQAIVVFSQPTQQLFVYTITLLIAPVNPDMLDMPSLLGRDVIDRWDMTYRPTSKELAFAVKSADAVIPIPPPSLGL